LYAEAPADWRTDPLRRTRIRELAQRAETLHESKQAESRQSQRLQSLQQRILAEDANGRLLDELDRIRLLGTEVEPSSNRFTQSHLIPMYRQAFAEYGLDAAKTSPQDAADKVRSRPPHVLEACIFGLEHWRSRLSRKVPESQWIDSILDRIDDDPWRREARRACRDKDWAAVDRLLDAAEKKPPSAEAVNLVADALMVAQQFELALKLLQPAQPRHPGDYWINEYLALAYHLAPASQLEESVRYHTAALAIRQTAATYQNLGYVLIRMHRDAEAERTLRSAARMQPDWALPHIHLAILLAGQDRLKEAPANIELAVAADPKLPRAASIHGQILAALGRRDEGIAALRRAIELDDRYADAHLALGKVFLDSGRLTEAADCLRRAIELDHKDVMAQAMLRDALTDLGQTEGAIEAARAVVALRGDADDYQALARLLDMQGKQDEAESIRKQGQQKADRRGRSSS